MKFKLSKFFKNYKWKMIFGPFFKFLEAVTDLITPILIALILDIGIPLKDKSYIIWLSIAVIGMNLVGFAFAIICQKFSAECSQGIGRDLRKDIYKKILTISSSEMDKYTTMSLTNRTVHDVSQVQTTIGMTIRQVSRAPFLLVGSTIMAMIINIKLSIIFAVVIPIILSLFFFVMLKTNPLYTKAKSDLDVVSNVTREDLSGNRVVRAFNKQQFEIEKFSNVNNNFMETNIKIGFYSSLLQPLLSLIANLSVVAVLYFGGFQVDLGNISQGQIISFINYLSQIAISLVVIARLIIVFTRTGASLKRISNIFELTAEISSQNSIMLTANTPPEIEFKNVSFSYNGIKDVVKNLSIKINAGETIGVIGGTGSGKSSLVNLLPRFYNVSKGEIDIAGTNINQYDLMSLRQYVSIVPQNPILFSGTIESNLKLKNKDASDEEIKKALLVSQSLDFVLKKENGIKSNVERGGRNFSGGQRQRLTVARALVGSPKILILDDSSSALDFETDYELRKAINTVYKNTTKIYVSQRTNSIKQADKIIVLDNGNVVGVGTHSNLLETCNVYKEIYESQNK